MWTPRHRSAWALSVSTLQERVLASIIGIAAKPPLLDGFRQFSYICNMMPLAIKKYENIRLKEFLGVAR